MQWNVDQIGFTDSPALHQFARRKAIDPLSRLAGQIRRVWVQLKSGDGKPHRGSHGASVQVVMQTGRTVHVEAWAGCHYAAVEQAAERARRSVLRDLGRRRTKQRRDSILKFA